ncbi:peptidase M20 domain-containing protein 2-like isoform X1 [Limulus polyphemus]|uniref:Peptidase M20 domain-containing protein 2 n=1 Tax=Limulus polyphemus TaxID=6850 RepID=A0ABM1BMZ6_LIMPO|nr:peptidase M20 domain-containing protein 2-like isoform X1 [Limulus polyphemus]
MSHPGFAAILKKIETEKEKFDAISKEVWRNPELRFEERHAHNLLADALEQEGFKVQRHYILPTAFRAEYPPDRSSERQVQVAVLCEYDALPAIGHACGHNLIAESSLAAGFAIKAALETDPSIKGKVIVIGTPAEEGGGGKNILIEGGAFINIDVALMAHPSPTDHLFPPFIGYKNLTVDYKGKAAHASGYPWEGINALDAVVACYNSLAFLRQQIKPTNRIHAIITKGGVIEGIIPEEAQMKIVFRAANLEDLKSLQEKVIACIFAAATSTGCEVMYNINERSYEHLLTNKELANTYKKHAEAMGVVFQDGDHRIIPFMASTDMGNVSHIVPSIHPTFSINTSAPNHSKAFTEAAGATAAQTPTLNAAKALALTGLEVLQSTELLNAVKRQFEEDIIAENIGSS